MRYLNVQINKSPNMTYDILFVIFLVVLAILFLVTVLSFIHKETIGNDYKYEGETHPDDRYKSEF